MKDARAGGGVALHGDARVRCLQPARLKQSGIGTPGESGRGAEAQYAAACEHLPSILFAREEPMARTASSESSRARTLLS